MKKTLLLCVFALLGLSALSAQNATQEPRQNPTVPPTPAQAFERNLNQLYLAVDKKDADQMIVLQSQLVGQIREAIFANGTATAGSEPARRNARMEAIFHAFEGFSFHSAGKDDADKHLALLEEFLALMSN